MSFMGKIEDQGLAAAAQGWLKHLAGERRLSPKTLEAYARDLGQFAAFLATHLGERPTLAAISGLKPLDVRAFLAARRREGVESRTLMRQLAALRSFARHLERAGQPAASAIVNVRGPRTPKTLPRPLTPASAKALADVGTRAGEERAPWVLARDAAVLGLLYGCGLRIGEALGLRRGDAPVGGRDAVTVLGKGGKLRQAPVIPQVSALVQAYLDQCPWRLPAEGPLFVGARVRAVVAARHPARHGAHARRARPAGQRDAARAPAFLRHASAGARRRPAQHPGAARPRLAGDDADLHQGGRRAVDGGLQERASEGVREGARRFDRPPRDPSPSIPLPQGERGLPHRCLF